MSLKKILSGCTNWSHLQEKIKRMPVKERGRIFADLVRLRMQSMSEYRSQLTNIWSEENAPASLRKKVGALKPNALIAETKSKKVWVIDCYFTTKPKLGWTEINARCSPIKKEVEFHLFCCPADPPEDHLKKRMGWFGLEVWEKTSSHDIQNIRRLANGKLWLPKKKERRPHQKEVGKAIVNHFKKATRGKTILPCGAGKSLIGYWAHLDLKSRRTLVTLPSLQLLRQTLHTWLEEMIAGKIEVNWACVCGDKSVSKVDDPHIIAQTLGIPCLTGVSEIQSWLKTHKNSKLPTIVFTTYQSGKLLAEASRREKFSFDLAIHDEAHKTAGRKGKHFAHTLHDRNVKIKKRMFMTATERRYNGDCTEVLSMEDPKIYGETIYSMSFKEAVQKNIICDHKILTVQVKASEIKELIETNTRILPGHHDWSRGLPARHLASLIALHKAMAKYPIKHALVFNNSIRNAELFREHNKTYCKIHKKSMESYHVSGRTPAGARAHILQQFENAETGLITNAKCLTEGVDVPNIDAIVFAEARRGVVDIVQGVGRAMRAAPGKTYGYIILPVIIESEDNKGKRKKKEKHGFQEILHVLRALAQSDDRVIQYFHNLQEGLIGEEDLPPWKEDDIHIPVDFEDFKKAIKVIDWRQSFNKKTWVSYEEARKYALSLKTTSTQWFEMGKRGEIPPNIPINPKGAYAGNGWVGWDHFLGTRKLKDWPPYEVAQEYAASLPDEQKSSMKWAKIAPKHLPKVPHTIYKDCGWTSWRDFFESRRLPFTEAREFARSLKFNHFKQWTAYCKGKFPHLPPKPKNIPTCPDVSYKKEWKGGADWVGVESRQQETWPDFIKARADARQVCKRLGIKTRRQWKITHGDPEKDKLPLSPGTVFKNRGWTTWDDWIKEPVPELMPFKEARKIAHASGIKSDREWRRWFDNPGENPPPPGLPRYPYHRYRFDGWVSFADWFNLETKSNNSDQKRARPKENPPKKLREKVTKERNGRKIRTNSSAKEIKLDYKKATALVKQAGLSSVAEYQHFRKQHPELPRIPQDYYKEWSGWNKWLKNYVVLASFNEATAIVKNAGISKVKEYHALREKHPELPYYPSKVYTEWEDWSKWFKPPTPLATFEEATKIVRREKISCSRDYARIRARYDCLPKKPQEAYQNKWTGWAFWTGKTGGARIKIVSFEEAREFARALNLKPGSPHWWKYLRGGYKGRPPRPHNIPTNPHIKYKKQWKGWKDFLEEPSKQKTLMDLATNKNWRRHHKFRYGCGRGVLWDDCVIKPDKRKPNAKNNVVISRTEPDGKVITWAAPGTTPATLVKK